MRTDNKNSKRIKQTKMMTLIFMLVVRFLWKKDRDMNEYTLLIILLAMLMAMLDGALIHAIIKEIFA